MLPRDLKTQKNETKHFTRVNCISPPHQVLLLTVPVTISLWKKKVMLPNHVTLRILTLVSLSLKISLFTTQATRELKL